MKFFMNCMRGSLLLAVLAGQLTTAMASDHDDGVTSIKNQALNLTDLYVFREDNQTGKSADKKNIVFIMNSSPRSLPEQQYYFSQDASYQFHISRVTADNKNTSPTGANDIILSFTFGAQDAMGQQPITITANRNGEVLSTSTAADGTKLMTTSIQNGMAGKLNVYTATLGGQKVKLFAGMREDPFFFDVEQFFKVRAGAAGLGPKVGFNPPGQAQDFTEDYNVNSIVVSVPIALLQTEAKEPVFDVWETVFINR